MRKLTTDATADQLLNHLASDGAGDKGTYYANLGECCCRGDDVGPASRPSRKLIRHPPGYRLRDSGCPVRQPKRKRR